MIFLSYSVTMSLLNFVINTKVNCITKFLHSSKFIAISNYGSLLLDLACFKIQFFGTSCCTIVKVDHSNSNSKPYALHLRASQTTLHSLKELLKKLSLLLKKLVIHQEKAIFMLLSILVKFEIELEKYFVWKKTTLEINFRI